jgi:hypothetical protein
MPFADVVCFFSDDLGGLKNIAKCLSTWVNNGCGRPYNMPHIVVVMEMISPSAYVEREAAERLIKLTQNETAGTLFKLISTIEVVALFPRATISSKSRYRLLKERLLTRLFQMRSRRESMSTLYSLTHFFSFFNRACEHYSKRQEPFDFVKSTRVDNPLSENLLGHLLDFIKQIRESQLLLSFAAPMIASSLLLDHYLPDTHCKLLQ